MKIIACISLIIFFGACSSKKEEVVDLIDIMPTSDYVEDVNSDSVVSESSFLSEIMAFRQEGIEVDSLEKIEKRCFPDRFGAKSTEKTVLFHEGSETHFFRWIYADSNKVMNAFYNWIDCFGDDCTSIFIGEEKRFQKNAMQLYVNDTSLIFIDSEDRLSVGDWRRYLSKMGYEDDWNYFVRQSRGGKAKWFTFVEKTQTPFER
ncbi:MAG: hypothetical protein MK066_09200 [Crocinitomicaceae bacterium]|nr:hypothetical protein [Crocinitomicaceae bacterium]